MLHELPPISRLAPMRRIHPDISWEQMNETAKMIAHTTAQQISWAIEESVSYEEEVAQLRAGTQEGER